VPFLVFITIPVTPPLGVDKNTLEVDYTFTEVLTVLHKKMYLIRSKWIDQRLHILRVIKMFYWTILKR